jgi:hypothetical protein
MLSSHFEREDFKSYGEKGDINGKGGGDFERVF